MQLRAQMLAVQKLRDLVELIPPQTTNGVNELLMNHRWFTAMTPSREGGV